MKAHPRHKATRERTPRHTQDPAEALQGAYGSGGSYGVGGGFADDEPGSKTEEARDTVPDLEPAGEIAPDVHTRASEIDDEALAEARRADEERESERVSRR